MASLDEGWSREHQPGEIPVEAMRRWGPVGCSLFFPVGATTWVLLEAPESALGSIATLHCAAPLRTHVCKCVRLGAVEAVTMPLFMGVFTFCGWKSGFSALGFSPPWEHYHAHEKGVLFLFLTCYGFYSD